MSATIALVDDDKNILTSVTIALEAEGYKVRTYLDGASALKALAEKTADLAVLDIKMPRMDGMELLRRLRQSTDMPVIFLTSTRHPLSTPPSGPAASIVGRARDRRPGRRRGRWHTWRGGPGR